MAKLLLILTLIFIVNSGWVIEDGIQFEEKERLFVAGQCKNITTSCRKPQIVTDYNYNGIIRSGYLNIVSKSGSALGFIFYGKQGAKQEELKNYPIVISLGGGPGLSSQFSNLKEIGPFVLKKVFSISIQNNTYAWTKQANLLFIDQPVGTGVTCLSKESDIPSTIAQVAKDFYQAFNQLFSGDGGADGCFNSKNLKIPASTPMFLFGEGYAGKFVSAIGSKIVQEKKNGGAITGLKGIGIGNGLNSPIKVLQQFGNFAFSMSLLDYQERIKVQKILLRASLQYDEKKWKNLRTSFERAINYVYERSGVNSYDITKDGADEGLSMVDSFFSNKTNLQRYAFEKDNTYETMSKVVYNKFENDFMQNEISSVEYLLKEEIPVLIYQGQDNAYVNPTGGLKWVDELNYDGSRQFRNANFQALKSGSKMLGSKKSVGKLTYIVINNAGHYVPQDNPQAALVMLRDFLKANK